MKISGDKVELKVLEEFKVRIQISLNGDDIIALMEGRVIGSPGSDIIVVYERADVEEEEA